MSSAVDADALCDDAVLYLLGEADAETVARLETVLRQDAAARARFAALARLHGNLGEIGRRAAAGSIDSARLLAAGPPPEMPATGRIVRPWRHWTGWATAAAVATAAGLALVYLAIIGALARPLLPTVAGVHGEVHLLRSGQEIALEPGSHLRVGDRMVATGGSLEIELQGGRFTLTPGAEAVIQEADGLKRQIELLQGEVIADLRSPGAPLAVHTRAGTVTVTDATAAIRFGARGIAVVVRRGSVDLTTPDGGSRTLRSGDPPQQVSAAVPACAAHAGRSSG